MYCVGGAMTDLATVKLKFCQSLNKPYLRPEFQTFTALKFLVLRYGMFPSMGYLFGRLQTLKRAHTTTLLQDI